MNTKEIQQKNRPFRETGIQGILLLTLLVLFAFTFIKAEAAETTKLLTVGQVTLEGENLVAGQFTFELYQSNVLIAETTNDSAGNISFQIPIPGPGIYQYEVQQKVDNQSNIYYDTNRYPITIAVEDKNEISSDFQSDLYYGLTVQSQYVTSDMTYQFYMGTTPGNKDYRVFCIDHSARPTPSTETRSPYWVAEVNPTQQMLLACVCNENGYSGQDYYSKYDGWCDDLTVSLKKMLYSITYGANRNASDLVKQTLVWQMTQGLSSVTSLNKSSILSIIYNTTVPDGYQLVLFHPSNNLYQSFVMLLPATQVQQMKTDTVLFKNRAVPTGYKLPSTGGNGRAGFIVWGLILIAGDLLIILIILTNMKNKKRRSK